MRIPNSAAKRVPNRQAPLYPLSEFCPSLLTQTSIAPAKADPIAME